MLVSEATFAAQLQHHIATASKEQRQRCASRHATASLPLQCTGQQAAGPGLPPAALQTSVLPHCTAPPSAAHLAAHELLLLHQRRALRLLLLPLLHRAAQRLDLLHHLGRVPHVG